MFSKDRMSNEVTKFLIEQAKSNGFITYDSMFGDICLNEKQPLKQSSGAVYGIFAQSNTPLNSSTQPINKQYYPIYWGKDIAPVSRLKAHIQKYKNTGSANLKGILEIKEKKLIFGAILVSKYDEFEKFLHHKYPPLKGTNRFGKKTQIIKIIN